MTALRVAMFGGGRGTAGLARRLLATPGVELSLLVNGYDNGLSTGALRRFLPGMLGPSDFRKNLLLRRDGDGRAALVAFLEHRLPPGTARRDLDGLTGALPGGVREAAERDLAAFRARLDADPGGFDLADCSVGNLVLAGAYLRSGGDFNAAVRACADAYGSPARLLNVTGGENAHLVAVKASGRVLADEAEIVAPQDPSPITGLFLLREPLTDAGRDELETLPPARVRWILRRRRAALTPNPEALAALRDADVIVYGPGTPHSSLLPSYLTPGVPDAVAGGRAAAKVLFVNLRDDHDVRGVSAPGHLDLALSYLGDPLNERGLVTHVVCHRPGEARADVPEMPGRDGVCRLLADLEEDPSRPRTHDAARAVGLLTDILACTNVPLERVG
ncbi:hypothetical protein BJF79_22565 [Actinomadura sp. CNU-125]|uniref:2-phospho-L-lactate transferase CofD family protein n=1 Tax=Actinomadura sp. CNU-125 TaxID=1904961 RepID=UPI000959C660|nr:2-phospho-L-lactate transferase CofD family protein [Actinomadura sp. CNU-125]OLT12296.1 hypothetical protein BJF79_22565 [Actinomadura sp. CNU-125]